MVNINKLNIEKIIQNNNVEELFQVDISKQTWVWINRDIFIDILQNVIEYDSFNEEELIHEIKNISEDRVIRSLNEKFGNIEWITVDQKLFESLCEDFTSTKDIETFIYMDKKVYTRKILKKVNELDWILKAMAVDTYQHLGLEDKNLIEVFKEYFEENGMVIEEILLTGEYKLNVLTWKLYEENNLLEFYKTDERYRQWAEGNAIFMFNEISK